MSSKIQHKTIVKRRENTTFITMHRQTHVRQRVYGVRLASSPTSDLQHRCPRRATAPKRSAAAAAPPGEKNIFRRQYTHNRVLHACLHHLDLQQRGPRCATTAQQPRAVPSGGSSHSHPKSSPPVRGEGVVVAQRAPAQRP